MSADSKLVSAIADACVEYLADQGELGGKLRASVELHTAARRVIWARHYYGYHGSKNDVWRAALDDLEKLVGRPDRESSI